MKEHSDLIIILLALAVFGLDLLLPLGVAGAIPYVAVVLLAAALSSYPQSPIRVAFLCTLLTLADYFLTANGDEHWRVYANRFLSILIIWTTAVLASLRIKAEERLREANRELDGFVRTVSHDLRGPLTGIIGFSELLQSRYEEIPPEEGREIAVIIERQGRRMHAFLEDLLELSRVGRLEAPEKPVDAEAIVAEVLRDLEESMKEAGVEVRIAPLPQVFLPETLLSLAFSNLIGNAVRYAPTPGKPIEVEGIRRGGRVRYCVRDHGPGIPIGERERIFELFFRGSAAKPKTGTGIGLATVRKIARAYHGRAWVEETPGGGSTFCIDIADSRILP